MDALSSKPRSSRRNIPSLGELHITPLTRDPLVQSPFADIDDEDPLASSQYRSYLSSRSLPQTPSILSRSPSRTRQRSRSRGHRRNAKSMLTLTSLDDGMTLGPSSSSGGLAPDGGPYTPGPYGPNGAKRPKSAMASGRQTPGRVRVMDRDRTDFLLRTASLLVESASESKGQGWISKRNSSTTLAAPSNWEEIRAERDSASAWALVDDFDGHSPALSRADGPTITSSALGNSRRGSRRGSVSGPSTRHHSRRNSRAGIGMRTPGGASTPRDGYFDNMSVEFGDEQDWDDEDSSDDEDIDEGELRRLFTRRVGGFFEDIFGGWLDFRGEDDEEDLTAAAELDEKEKEAIAAAAARGDEAARKKLKFAGIKREDIVKVKPPADAGGTWSDARWLVGLARRALI